MTTPIPPVYLVTLTDLETNLPSSDVSLSLEEAVQQVYFHLMDYYESSLTFDVSVVDSELRGIGFMSEQGDMLACISVYRLDRDDTPIEPFILEALPANTTSKSKLTSSLKSLFKV